MSDIAYVNGRYEPASSTGIDLSDRGFTLADGVFDTMLAADGILQHAEEHFARLARHAGILDIPLHEPPQRLSVAAAGLLVRNGLNEGRVAIRTTLTRGPAPRGLNAPANPQPTLVMRVSPVPEPKSGKIVVIAETVRRNEGSPLSRIKSLNCGDQLLALAEAQRRHADDAVLLNNKGYACCATAANLFIDLDGQWHTPPLSDGVLDGVTRAHVMKERSVREQSLTVEMLKTARALYLCNSLTGLQHVRLI